jgi:hypothetical protein
MLDIYQERQQLCEAAKTAKMRAGTMGLDEGHAPHLRDAMDILNDVWNEITPLKVKNCWVKTTLISVVKPGKRPMSQNQAQQLMCQVLQTTFNN